MATSHNIQLTDTAFNAIKSIKGSISYSDVIKQLVKEHHELAKIKLDMERTAPC